MSIIASDPLLGAFGTAGCRANHFGVHYMTVSRTVRRFEGMSLERGTGRQSGTFLFPKWGD